MEYLNFPIVALGAALVCLISVTLYALTQRASLRSRDEQLVVARAQAYAMLELSQAGVLFLDREHKLMGEASAAAPELLGHTCGAGTAFVQVIADLVDVHLRRDTAAFLETLWQAAPSSVVDATQNPLARVHSGSRHLAIRFARLVVDGRVHHIIVSIERISAPRVVPQTIEVPVLNEDTFAKRLAGETGTRPALNVADLPASPPDAGPVPIEAATAEQPLMASPAETPAVANPEPVAETASSDATATPMVLPALSELGPLDITEDSLPSMSSLPGNAPGGVEMARHLATTIVSEGAMASEDTAAAEPRDAGSAPKATPATPDPSGIVDPADARLSEVLKEILRVEPARLENFLGEARDKAGQLRAIIKLPAREPQAFREKLVLILELIRGIHARAERLPLPSVCERAERFADALGKLRDKPSLSGNDFLPLAVKLDDLLSHLAIQGEVVGRLRDWRALHGVTGEESIDATQRSATATHTTIRQPRLRAALPEADASTVAQPPSETQQGKRLSDLSQGSLEEMAHFLADMYAKKVSLVVVGLEDVPAHYRRSVEKILGQLIHNAVRHGIEPPVDRAMLDKPETGTVSVQFVRLGSDGYQLSVQDDGRGLDHERIRAEAIRQGVLSAEDASNIDSRKLASLIFRPGFTTVSDGGARGIGMDVVRELVTKSGGRVGIATKPGEYTRFRISLPHEKKAADAAVA